MSFLDRVRLIAAFSVTSSKAFGVGWIEGHNRYKADGSPSIVPGSMFTPGTVEFAASQAAVAFYIGRERR